MQDHELIKEVKEFAKSEALDILLKRIEANYIEKWKSTPENGGDTREHCWCMVLAVNALRDEIANVAQTDKVNEYNRRLHGKLT
jgi:hypothetical protein